MVFSQTVIDRPLCESLLDSSKLPDLHISDKCQRQKYRTCKQKKCLTAAEEASSPKTLFWQVVFSTHLAWPAWVAYCVLLLLLLLLLLLCSIWDELHWALCLWNICLLCYFVVYCKCTQCLWFSLSTCTNILHTSTLCANVIWNWTWCLCSSFCP